ncbi:MAG: hypothetical protein JNL54_04235 [Kineosporiaceae bacterium]|nr:hypothetical protein [Kineosporiaceae bacterium]
MTTDESLSEITVRVLSQEEIAAFSGPIVIPARPVREPAPRADKYGGAMSAQKADEQATTIAGPNAVSEVDADDPARPARRLGVLPAEVQVAPDGTISTQAAAADGVARGALSQVTAETFYMPDLNKIAAAIRDNMREGTTTPSDPARQILVDREGNIYSGDEIGGSARPLSQVTSETFYAWGDRSARELAIVQTKLPANTVHASDGDVDGWAYSITNEFGDTYTLFLWFDASNGTYKVSLVEPRLGGQVGVEDCHLYEDGTLCLKREGGPGYASMENAYARSVIWTRGASCYRRGYGFQFNLGQGA